MLGQCQILIPWQGKEDSYLYDGGNKWTLVCDELDNQVSSLAVYKGKLYIGIAWQGGRLYKYKGPNNCKNVISITFSLLDNRADVL